ncbi:MAG: hypothetical protein AAB442_00200 [Patescibacteria group bacterium]
MLTLRDPLVGTTVLYRGVTLRVTQTHKGRGPGLPPIAVAPAATAEVPAEQHFGIRRRGNVPGFRTSPITAIVPTLQGEGTVLETENGSLYEAVPIWKPQRF